MHSSPAVVFLKQSSGEHLQPKFISGSMPTPLFTMCSKHTILYLRCSSRQTCSNRDLALSLSLLIVLLFSLANIQSALAQDDPPRNPSLLERFWEIGCEFSGVVTRVRRSASPTPEEPNFDDPEELFKYLYPLADVKPGEEAPDGSQRSKYGSHSLSSWLEDLLELWHSECHHRRSKRASRRMSEFNREASTEPRRRFHGMFEKRNREESSSTRNSSLGAFSRRQDGLNDDENSNGGYKYELPTTDGSNGTDPNSDLFRGVRDEQILQEIEDEKDKEKDKLKPSSTTAAPATAPVITPVDPPKKEDIFFAQYGGDIEYFFPLLSFGIPFDGEITLLGFHGFRGIFPY